MVLAADADREIKRNFGRSGARDFRGTPGGEGGSQTDPSRNPIQFGEKGARGQRGSLGGEGGSQTDPSRNPTVDSTQVEAGTGRRDRLIDLSKSGTVFSRNSEEFADAVQETASGGGGGGGGGGVIPDGPVLPEAPTPEVNIDAGGATAAIALAVGGLAVLAAMGG